MKEPLKVKDIAWVAGLLEGEGCFATNKWKDSRYLSGYSQYPMVTLAMTDKDTLEKYASFLSAKLYGPFMAKKSTKPYWVVRLTSSKAAGLMMTILPLVGERRRNKIMGVLAEWRNKPSRNYPNAAPYLPT